MNSEFYPLSFAQERMWFVHEVDEPGPAYNIAFAVKALEPINVEVARRALAIMMQRHPNLRSCIARAADGLPKLRVQETVDVPLSVETLDDAAASSRHNALDATLHRYASVEFDLYQAPLWNVKVINSASVDATYVLLCIHHIVADGWSIRLFLEEFFAAYEALQAGVIPLQDEVGNLYGDYVTEQRSEPSQRELRALCDEWTKRLADAPTILELPAARPRALRRRFEGGSICRTFTVSHSDAIQHFSSSQKKTNFEVIASAFLSILHRWSGSEDIVIGVPFAGRTQHRYRRTIGLFSNIVVIRSTQRLTDTFANHVNALSTTLRTAKRYQDVPFEWIAEKLGSKSDPARHPVYQVMINYVHYSERELRRSNIALEAVGIPRTSSAFDITLCVENLASGAFGLRIQYDTALFWPETVSELARQTERLLEFAVAAPDTPVYEWDLRHPLPAPVHTS